MILAEEAVPEAYGGTLGNGPLRQRAAAGAYDSPQFVAATGGQAGFQLLLAASACGAGQNGGQVVIRHEDLLLAGADVTFLARAAPEKAAEE